MLHNESREFLVNMYNRTHDAGQTAKTFEVSKRQVYRIVKQYRETGSVAVRTSQRGRKPKLTSEDLERVDKAIKEQPDITFGELIERLQLDISESRLGRIVREKLGYSLKKKVIHASEQERPRCATETVRMETNRQRNSGRKPGIPG